MSDRLARVIERVDALNAEDPVRVPTESGPRPKEVVHAEAMSGWVARLDPEADILQRIAARAHHLRRWTVPRDSYPDGRAGYLRWRSDLRARHAEDVGTLLREEGFTADEIASVQAIIRKDDINSDPRVQTHEDALCLVFMEQQLIDLVERLGAEKSAGVLRKTVAKMSSRGRSEAVGLVLEPAAAAMIATAVEGVEPSA